MHVVNTVHKDGKSHTQIRICYSSREWDPWFVLVTTQNPSRMGFCKNVNASEDSFISLSFQPQLYDYIVEAVPTVKK